MNEPGRPAEIKARLATVTPWPWFRSRVMASGDATVRSRDGNRPVARIRSVDRDELWPDPDEQAQVDAEFIAHAPADIDWLVAEVDRLRGLLARLEWAGTVVFDEWYDKGKCCPVPECRAEQGDPHAPGCWLAAELKR